MEKQTVILEKERDFTDLLNATFAFISQEIKPLFKVMCLYAGILIIASAIMQSYFSEDTISSYIQIFRSALSGEGGEVQQQFNSSVMVIMYVVMLLSKFFICGLSFAYLVVYRDKGRNNFEIKDVWNTFFSKLPLALALSIVTILMYTVGCIFLVIPGIYMIVPLSFVLIVLYAENKNFGESISRSFKLVSNNWWFTFGLLIIVGLIVIMLGLIFSLPATIYTFIVGLTAATKDLSAAADGINSVPFIITTVIAGIGEGLIAPILYIAVGFQYFNLKEKSDNTSLFRKVSEISKE